MRKLWLVVYNVLGVPSIWIFFRIFALFNSKVREGLNGRRDLFSELDRSLAVLEGRKRVLIHCSSLGEYQQSVPLAEQFMKKGFCVVNSFFSPSGFRHCKISGSGMAKTYLPMDSYGNVSEFLEKVSPEIIVFMRYDLWYNLICRAKSLGIRLVIANARFDENDRTWSLPVVSSFKKTMYRMLDDVFVIDEFDEENYKKILDGYGPKVVRAGDSKFERVLRTSKEQSASEHFPGIDLSKKKVFVMGSSWKDDEEVLLPAIDKALNYHEDLLVMLVPHEPKETKLNAIERSLGQYRKIRSVRLSGISKYKDENLIIIDRVGILSKLYSAACLSYVGGGFKTGLHNILEPAIFNMPIFFANEVKNSDEDEILISCGCGIVVKNTRQFYRRFRELLSDAEMRKEIGMKCEDVFRNSAGIAETIVNHIT